MHRTRIYAIFFILNTVKLYRLANPSGGRLWYLVEDAVSLVHEVISTVSVSSLNGSHPLSLVIPCGLGYLVEDAVCLVYEVISTVPCVLPE